MQRPEYMPLSYGDGSPLGRAAQDARRVRLRRAPREPRRRDAS
jgi:hypothetical protein